jgi:ferredoxin
VFWAPGAFELDDAEGLAIVIDPDAVELERLKAAERGCPTQAITVED